MGTALQLPLREVTRSCGWDDGRHAVRHRDACGPRSVFNPPRVGLGSHSNSEEGPSAKAADGAVTRLSAERVALDLSAGFER